jgi:hypothetical protein
MGFRCPYSRCSASSWLARDGRRMRCERGHTVEIESERALRFLDRATSGVEA